MADDEQNKPSVSVKSYFTEDYDPTLDFYSEQFDPLKALQTANIKIPVPNSKVYDNLSKYESAQRGLSTEPKAKAKQEAANIKFERKFEPHQMPIRTERKIINKNILTKMESFDGPLALLKKCVDDRLRIKVFTRTAWGIRGFCLAFISAFDKHWNMALEDVTEIWSRKKKRKVPAFGSLSISEKAISRTRKIEPPRIVITKTTKKLEFCERYVPQLIIRGEQVAFVNIIK